MRLAGGRRVTTTPSSPTVSVIVPAFNTRAYVGAAIASALKQTGVEVEVLVCDDGSTDGTGAVLEEWARRDPRVRVFAHPQSCGCAAARNTGLAAARGRYFAFLDSDDEWEPEFLSTQLRAFDAFPDASVVTGNAVSRGGPFDGRPLRSPDHPPRRLSLLEIIEHEDAVNIMSVFKREVCERIGGFDPELRHSEDYDFWLRAATAGFVFVQTPEPLVNYRRRPGSISSDELKMMAGIVVTLARTRARCEGKPAEIAAIDRQIARFEREAILLRAKAALRARAFQDAAGLFRLLYEREPRPAWAAVAFVSRLTPRALWWADRLRTSMRRPATRVPWAAAPGRS